MTWAVEWSGVTKDFATGLFGQRLRAVDSLTLRLEAGRVHGLLGPNGSGKSTAIKLLLGLVKPTRGACAIFGCSSRTPEARREVGYLPESPNLHPFLTARELLTLHGRLAGLGRLEVNQRSDEVLAWVGLTHAADRRLGTFSKGMLQRAGLAQALVHRPRLVILDEPTAAVDPAGTNTMLELIRRMRDEGTTVLLTSHLLGSIEALCDHVALLDRGRLVMAGDTEALLGDEERWVLAGRGMSSEDRAELERWLGARGWTAQRGQPEYSRLEQKFLERVGRDRRWGG